MKALLGGLSTLLLGLASGVSFSHFLQRDPKSTLSGPQFLAVQQILLRNYGPAIGGLEVAAFLSTLGVAIVTWGDPVVPLRAMFAAACVLASVAIWAVWINPINKTVNSWTPESLPRDWGNLRDRWHLFHTIRLVLLIAAFAALIGGLLR